MVDMFIFWIVYGIVTVLYWATVLTLSIMILNSLIVYITDGDYDIDKWEEYLSDIFFELNFYTVVGAFGFTVNLIISFNAFVGKGNTHHEIALSVSQWALEYLSIPIIIGVLVAGFVIGARKAYPKFKKVKQALNKIEQQVDKQKD